MIEPRAQLVDRSGGAGVFEFVFRDGGQLRRLILLSKAEEADDVGRRAELAIEVFADRLLFDQLVALMSGSAEASSDCKIS